MDLSAGSPDPAVRRLTRRRLEQMLDLVGLFNPQSVVCHAGYDAKRYGYSKDTWSEYSLEFWSRVADRVGEHGARLMLENVYEDGPQDLQFFFERLNHQQVGFCLDAGHASAFGQAGLAAWLGTLGPYLGQLHLHDNSGTADEHLVMGRGMIDFSTIFEYLRKNKTIRPIVTLEPHEEKDLWPSLEYLAKQWPW